MGKMNFSTYEDSTETVSVTPADIVDAGNTSRHDISIPAAGMSVAGKAAAGAVPVMAVLSLVTSVLGVFSDIGNCIASVSVEKQRTKQIQAQADAHIRESIESTKRIKIQEKEATKRLIIECKAKIEEKKYELEKLYEDNRLREIELSMNHDEFMGILNILDKAIETIIQNVNMIRASLPDVNTDKYELEKTIRLLDEKDSKLIELCKNIAELRKG